MTLNHSLRFIVGAAVVAMAVAALGAPVAADEMQDARDYCESVGGEVQELQGMWDSDGDQSESVDPDRMMEVCRFQADDEAQSQIYVELMTLYQEEPNLAAAAYLAKVPMSDGPLSGNPASVHCADQGGSSQFEGDASGGGSVDTDDSMDAGVAMCVFPDGSAIDEWGIAYYSDGAVRGADLAPLFRSDADSYPASVGG